MLSYIVEDLGVHLSYFAAFAKDTPMCVKALLDVVCRGKNMQTFPVLAARNSCEIVTTARRLIFRDDSLFVHR